MIKHKHNYIPSLRLLPFVTLIAVLSVAAVSLLPSQKAQALDAIAQSYKISGTEAVAGALVSTTATDTGTVELATESNAKRLVGAIAEKPLLILGGNEQSTVQVATSGLSYVIVSDASGQIKPGDKITVSPIAGVGMKATGDATIVGVAEEAANLDTATTRTINDKNGTQQTVHLSSITVRIAVTTYVTPKKQTFIPGFIQNFANRLAGHDVSPLRIVCGAFLSILLIVGVAAILHAAVRSSIISIGRNPLAADSVRKALRHMYITVAVLGGFGMAATYLVLTL